MILVPPLLVAGLAGHLFLLLVAWLLSRGRSRLEVNHGEAPRWPPELGLIAIAMGALAIAAIAVTVGETSRLRTRPLEWALFASIAATHTVAFVLLLLRVGAARYFIAVLSLGWGIAFVLQLDEARPGELPVAIALIAGLVGIAVYALQSRRIRSVLR